MVAPATLGVAGEDHATSKRDTVTSVPTFELRTPFEIGATASSPAQRSVARTHSSPWRRVTILLAASLATGFVAGRAMKWDAVSPRPVTNPADDVRDRDLLARKAEAEFLFVQDRLPEAHAAYRDLTYRMLGQQFTSPLTWDLPERTKVDQDRVYWILMTRMRGADKALNLPKRETRSASGIPVAKPAWPDPTVRASGRR